MRILLIMTILALGLNLFAAPPAAAQRVRFDFTEEALKALANNEQRRTRMCLANDARMHNLRTARKKLAADVAEARALGRPDLAQAFERDLAAVEQEIDEVNRNLGLCKDAFLLKPLAASFCRQIGPLEGTLCEAYLAAEEAGAPDPRFVDTLEIAITSQGAKPWSVEEAPALTSPDNRQIRATVRRGNLQVSFRIGAEGFVIVDPPEEENQRLVRSLKEVNAAHGLNLVREGFIYTPFIQINAFGGAGLAGETHQVMVGIKGEESFVPLGPALPVSFETGVATHGLPLTAEAWSELSSFDMIGIVGTRRIPGEEGEEPQDKYLYFLGLETLGLKPLMDELMDYYRGF